MAEPHTNIPLPLPPPPPLVMPPAKQTPRSPVHAANNFAPAMQPVPDPTVVTDHDMNWLEDDTAVNLPFNNREFR